MQDPTAQWVLMKRGTKNGVKRETKKKVHNKTSDTTAYKGTRLETKQNLNFK